MTATAGAWGRVVVAITLAIGAALALIGVGTVDARGHRSPSGGLSGPAELGAWQLLADESPIMPVHAALVRTGKVLLIAGSGNHRGRFEDREFRTVLWDPGDRSFSDVPTPWDAFCAGHSFLADGRLLVAGGTREYPDPPADFGGTRKAYAFDPIDERYEAVARMHEARWYPSLVTLGNGRIYAIAGRDETGIEMARTPEVFRPGADAWAAMPDTPTWPFYPALFLSRGGGLLYSGGYVFGSQGITAGSLDVATSTLTPVGGPSDPDMRDQSASVLLPPAQRQRVMIIGGGNTGTGQTTDAVDVIDLRQDDPQYRSASPLLHARMHVSAVLLPDRTVFVTGGGGGNEMDPVFASEIYDPAADSWREVAAASVARLYHSMALLLPDGRVLAAGSNPDGHEEHRIEIYSPPYLFAGPRPHIREAPRAVAYGSTFRIRTTQAADAAFVSLIRPSAVTHSTDTEQRVVNVASRYAGPGALDLTVTGDPTIAPPGWYMLFVTNGSGVPSVAKWVRLS